MINWFDGSTDNSYISHSDLKVTEWLDYNIGM